MEFSDMARKTDLIDSTTGEVIEQGFLAFEKPKMRHPYGKKWCFMNLNAIKALKECKSANDFRVLMAVLEKLEFQNQVVTQQKDIAVDLKMRPAHVSTSIKNLVAFGVLHKDENRRGFYTVDESFFWRGHLHEFPRMLERQEKAKRSRKSPPAKQ